MGQPNKQGAHARLPGHKLTLMQEQFVKEYFKDFSPVRAAMRAGYTAKSAPIHASHLLNEPNVVAAIEAQHAVLARRLDISGEKILRELAKIGFANMRDFMTIGPDGAPVLNWAELTHDQAAAIAEVTVDEEPTLVREGRGKKAQVRLGVRRRVRFKLHNKQQALVDLGKHLGLFVERTMDVTPVDPARAKLKDEALAEIIALLQAKTAAKAAGLSQLVIDVTPRPVAPPLPAQIEKPR